MSKGNQSKAKGKKSKDAIYLILFIVGFFSLVAIGSQTVMYFLHKFDNSINLCSKICHAIFALLALNITMVGGFYLLINMPTTL